MCPGLGSGAASWRSIDCQAASGFSARRASERPIASMRLRVAASISSASASSRASRRSAQRGERLGDAGERPGEAIGGGGKLRRRRIDVAFGGAPGGEARWLAVGALDAGEDLLADQPQERLGRVGAAGVHVGKFGAFVGKPGRPAIGGQRAGRLQGGVQRGFQFRALGDQFLHPARQAAGARPAALRTQQPAAQFRGLVAAQRGGERRIGGVEQVVAFVEHVAGRHGVVVQPAPGGLRHHQGVVGHHQFGGAGAADGVFDEAFPPMGAGGVDALAAAVGQAGDQGGAEQFGEPAGQVAALQVAVVGRQRPADDQAQRHRLLLHEPGGGGARPRLPGSAGTGSSRGLCG